VGELFVPAGASASHPQPAILTTNGFGGSYTDQVPLAEYFAGTQHYVVLAYSGLGFGGSGCNIELDSPAWDGEAASQLVSYLGRLSEVVKDGRDDPRVGMIGDSYGGAVQLAAASVDPRIDAIVPQITWNDLAYSLAPNNLGASVLRTDRVPGVLKYEWISYFFADGATTPISQYRATPFPPSSCPGYDPQVCPDLATSAAEGYPSRQTINFLRDASMITYHRTVDVPTLLMQGEDDTLFNIDEAIANAKEISANGAPVKLVLQSWGHSNDVAPAPGELSYAPGTKAYETILIDDWFAKYLRHEDVCTGPAVEFFRPWVHYTGSAEPAYGTAARLPVGHDVTLYLSGASTAGTNGTLTTSLQRVRAGTSTFANPPAGAPESYSETSVLQFEPPFQAIPPSDAPGSYAAWETGPLPRTIDSIGLPTLRFTLTAPVASAAGTGQPVVDPVIYTKIYGVSPSGSKTLADRLVAPVRVPDPGQQITVTLPAEPQRFAKGDRIELVVAATDSAYLGNRTPQPYSITVNPAHPAVLTLPENLPGQEASGGPRATGTSG
jgi:predicted acyl esterase